LTKQKPPRGVMPRFLWEEMRLKSLQGAISRRLERGFSIDKEWIDEYNELVEKVGERK
jgi:hypothetical protein